MKYLKTILKNPYYLIIAIDGSLGLAILYWWLLAQTTTLAKFFETVKGEPIYLYLYVASTIAAVIIFGFNLAVAVYLFHLRSAKNSRTQSINAAGAVVGAFGSACPVCGAFLLSLVGVSGGLAIFPMKGLEFKFLSLALIVLALYFSLEKLPKLESSKIEGCEECGFEKKSEKYNYSLPVSVLVLFSIVMFSGISGSDIFSPKVKNPLTSGLVAQDYSNLYEETAKKVLPPEGFQTKIKWGNIGPKLVDLGVIDLDKFKKLYEQRNGWDSEKEEILAKNTDKNLYINYQNANFMVNVLWALGLANKNPVLDKSPMLSKEFSLFNFASTGGWNLGKEKNGGVYYGKFPIIELTEEQQKVVSYIADRAYRPCCNNPTSFPDCNHGAALLGLLELGASQGLSQDELFDAALKFNSFWFQQNYLETALYFKVVENKDWGEVNPEEILGFNYSSASGWSKNIDKIVKGIPGLLPEVRGGGGCGA